MSPTARNSRVVVFGTGDGFGVFGWMEEDWLASGPVKTSCGFGPAQDTSKKIQIKAVRIKWILFTLFNRNISY